MKKKHKDQAGHGFDQNKYDAEVKERWGETDAYKEAARRTRDFSEEDLARIKEEAEEVELRLAGVFLAGHAPSDEPSMDAAEAHRLHMENFYPCSHAMHVGLGQMYTADPRFTEHYDKRGEGLAAFLQAAIGANARRAGEVKGS
jgi:hypothetical protein